ncbi:MAG: hypothetical protein MMC23_001290 [Stictis urceolatum]|nr:hypothetical protein [Stictis urceolata]
MSSPPPPPPSTHSALVLTSRTSPLAIKSVPTPPVVPGSIVIQVLAAPIISYARSALLGQRAYPIPIPLIPGTSAIGRVAAIGPDTTSLKPVQLVYVDPTIRGRDDASSAMLLGAHEGASEGSKILSHGLWRDGTWAEYVRVPLEVVVPLDEKRILGRPEQGGMGVEVEQLAGLAAMLVPFGGLKAVGVKAGETVLISPATGAFGGAAVSVALAMGARVVAWGRNESVLEGIRARGKGRVQTLVLTGDLEKDTEAVKGVGKVDVFFDISPPQAKNSGHLKAGILGVRQEGRVCLMGGIYDDVAIPHAHVVHKDITIKGKWMYDREDMTDLVKMIEAGVLSMNEVNVTGKFKLEEWDEALTVAEETGAAGVVTVFKP